MHYMIAFHELTDDFAKRQDPDAAGPYWGAWNAYIGAMGQAGVIVSGNGLLPPETASTVRMRNGQREVHDGPRLCGNSCTNRQQRCDGFAAGLFACLGSCNPPVARISGP